MCYSRKVLVIKLFIKQVDFGKVVQNSENLDTNNVIFNFCELNRFEIEIYKLVSEQVCV